MLSRVVACASFLLLAACDAFYGAESTATFAGPVDIGCVNAALASVPGTGQTTYRRDEDRSTELLPKHRKVLIVSHAWTYGEGGADILQINQTPDSWEYRNARSRINVRVTHEEIERFLPLMRTVNGVVQARCGLPVANLPAEPVGATKQNEL
jgi:hypothetical protein